MCRKKKCCGLAIGPSFYSEPMEWSAEKVWECAGTTFVHSFHRRSTWNRFCIRKPRSIVDLYVDRLPEFRHGRIVELGIADGGGTALIALAAEPSLLVACEIENEPVAALDEFISRRGLEKSVRPHYGVDQSDRARLAAIVDAEFGANPIDLVIDDASHRYVETRASFEVLYPRVRSGGLFVIEDWAAQYLFAYELDLTLRDPASQRYTELKTRLGDKMTAREKPASALARLGAELMFAAAQCPDVVASVDVNQHWISVTRGPASLEPATFQVTDLCTDYFRWFRA